MSRLKALAIVVMTWLPLSASAEVYLLMAEEQGCIWCVRWNEEVAPIYPKTAEGRTAPLKRYDLFTEEPGATLKSSGRFTPTFILVRDGQEVGRIEGYPGEEFFWGLLGLLFERANIPLDQTG